MRSVLVAMTGIGFTLGVVFGLLVQLPIDNTLSSDSPPSLGIRLLNISSFRSRSLREESLQQYQVFHLKNVQLPSDERVISATTIMKSPLNSIKDSELTDPESDPYNNNNQRNDNRLPLPTMIAAAPQRFLIRSAQGGDGINNSTLNIIYNNTARWIPNNASTLVFTEKKLQARTNHHNSEPNDKQNTSQIINLKLTLIKPSLLNREKRQVVRFNSNYSQEDVSYIASIVNGVTWTHRLEDSCPKPFLSESAEMWRKHTEGLDVVQMEQGCGRMQNRLVTFRDASKACVRYRLNTDQIQGEIYTYYLSRLLNMSNIPPTMLAQVNSLSSRWKTVHLKMSLAQWADSKLVVLTKYIEGLAPAHIPTEFREEGRRLEPTLQNLGAKSHPELCELVQWSDLIVLDYLTANLDRVINNMFNRQWNDQMMNNPAHNLERQPDGGLVFLDNESGLFHGYRLLDKYSDFHRSLLQSLCVFRESTATAVKRLYQSSSIGEELHKLFASSEVLHKHLAAITVKTVKILQQRLHDVYQQITQCELLFNR